MGYFVCLTKEYNKESFQPNALLTSFNCWKGLGVIDSQWTVLVEVAIANQFLFLVLEMEESQQSPIQATLLCCLDSYTASKMEGGGEELENGEKKEKWNEEKSRKAN